MDLRSDQTALTRNRSRAERDILFSPYFLKRYKQRWYMLGRREKDGGIRTYALARYE